MDTQTTADSLENLPDGNPWKDTHEQCPVCHLIRENERLMAETERYRQAYLAALETLDRANRVIGCCAVPMRSAS